MNGFSHVGKLSVTGLLALTLSPASGVSQTILDAGSAPPVKPGQHRASAAPDQAAPDPAMADAAASAPPAPLPESAAKDAITQREGEFPELAQPGIQAPTFQGAFRGGVPSGGGMIQHAWNHAPSAAGVADYAVCKRCVYRVRTREMMVTTIILPDGVSIAQADLGDPAGFDVEVRSANMLVVRPAGFGADTNLNVYTDAGVFAFYLRSEGFNSGHVSDLLVRISDPGGVIEGMAPAAAVDEDRPGEISDKATTKAPKVPAASGDAAKPGPVDTDTGVLSRLKPRHEEGDFIERVEFDPGKLHGFDDYTLWGDEAMKPETVFRDEHFTYIQFGRKWTGIELPVAFVVIDRIDEQVNTRVQGRTYIIESVAPLITLKSGTKFICIKFEGGVA